MKPDIHIIALGARTPVGLRAESSAAAVRAGISRARQHPTITDRDGEPLVIARDARLDEEVFGWPRVAALAASAIAEVASKAADCICARVKPHVLLSLPEDRPGFSEADARRVLQEVSREVIPILGTPTFVKFSRLRGTISANVERLRHEAFDRWCLELNSLARLRPSGDDYDGGLELVGDEIPVRTETEALAQAPTGEPFALAYLFRRIPGLVALYCFDAGPDEFSATLSFESNLYFYRSDEYEDGQLLKAFLTSVVLGLQPDVCGYGRDNAYRIRHESLDPAQVLARLRSGELFEVGNPAFHAFALPLVDAGEIPELMRSHPVGSRVKYSITGGYHLLTNIP